jgi:hypothetical protein
MIIDMNQLKTRIHMISIQCVNNKHVLITDW